jgi:hypothetical protein
VRFEVLGVVGMIVLFWVVMSCIILGKYQHFRETYCLHLSSLKCWYLRTSLHSVMPQNIVKTNHIFSASYH